MKSPSMYPDPTVEQILNTCGFFADQDGRYHILKSYGFGDMADVKLRLLDLVREQRVNAIKSYKKVLVLEKEL